VLAQVWNEWRMKVKVATGWYWCGLDSGH